MRLEILHRSRWVVLDGVPRVGDDDVVALSGWRCDTGSFPVELFTTLIVTDLLQRLLSSPTMFTPASAKPPFFDANMTVTKGLGQSCAKGVSGSVLLLQVTSGVRTTAREGINNGPTLAAVTGLNHQHPIDLRNSRLFLSSLVPSSHQHPIRPLKAQSFLNFNNGQRNLEAH
jgi:hypothetical protein